MSSSDEMKDNSSGSEDKKFDWSEKDVASRVGVSVLASISTFSGLKDEQARRFINDFEEALDLANIESDKYKKFHFKTKLRGLPAEWYETTRNEEKYRTWDSLKASFLQQFERTIFRPKDVVMRLMNIKQNVENNESIQSLSIRITHLFNDYKHCEEKFK
jgi:hypothetical protein